MYNFGSSRCITRPTVTARVPPHFVVDQQEWVIVLNSRAVIRTVPRKA